MKLFICSLVMGLLCCSCSTRLMDVTAVSTKNIDLNNMKGYSTAVNSRVKGEDVVHIVCFIPLGIPNAQEAVDKAIEKNGSSCVGLSNAVFHYKGWWIPLIYGQEKIIVEGDPIYKN